MANDDAEFTVRLTDEVTRPAKDAKKSLEGLEGGFSSLEEIAKGAMRHVGELIVEVAVEAGKMAAELVKKFGEAAIEAASFAQTSKLAISELTHSFATGATEFDNVRKMAQDLGLDVHDTVHSFQELLAAQFSIGQSKDIIKLGGDLQVIGASAQQVQSVFLAMSQIKSVGVLQGGDIRQLEQAGISGKLIFEALAKDLGLTGKELENLKKQGKEGPEALAEATAKAVLEVQKLQQAGKISADTGIAAVLEAVMTKVGESELGEAGKHFADATLKGAAARLKSGFTNAMIDIGTAIQPSLDAIGALITGSMTRLTESGKLQQLSDALVTGFTRFTDFIEVHWPEIEAIVVKGIDLTILGINKFVQVLGFVEDHWSAIRAVVDPVISAVLAAVALLDMLTNADIAIANWVAHIIELGTELSSSAANWAGELIAGFVQGIENFASQAIDKVKGFANTIASTFQDALGIHSDSTVFKDMAGHVAGGFSSGIAANDHVIQGATADMATSAMKGVEGGSSGGGGTHVSMGDIVVNVPAGAGASSPQDIASAVRRELERMFETLQAA